MCKGQFIETLGEVCEKTGWRIHAFVLMANLPQDSASGRRLLAELKRRRRAEVELGRRLKGDAGKVAIAVRLRAETEMTVKWIAERLQMGAPGCVNHLRYRRRKTEPE